jgi:hypothetical protein
VLFHGGRRQFLLQRLQVGRDVDGLHLIEPVDAAQLGPLGEAPRRVEVRPARVVVGELGGEEFPEAPLGLRAAREDGGRGEPGSAA